MRSRIVKNTQYEIQKYLKSGTKQKQRHGVGEPEAY